MKSEGFWKIGHKSFHKSVDSIIEVGESAFVKLFETALLTHQIRSLDLASHGTFSRKKFSGSAYKQNANLQCPGNVIPTKTRSCVIAELHETNAIKRRGWLIRRSSYLLYTNLALLLYIGHTTWAVCGACSKRLVPLRPLFEKPRVSLPCTAKIPSLGENHFAGTTELIGNRPSYRRVATLDIWSQHF